ncbi:MAG: CBS domain-containing protein [Armatimonadetes bacterium]|nr:CBS domain-containing protein [Armatimonadota bacterium]MBI2247564.1 CBS domain-containing protein [Armatimonadota bacterium]
MEAREIMNRDVITVAPEMTVEEATNVLLRYRIHGAPVVGADGQLIGMVSFVDLAKRTGDTVGQVMVSDPVCADEDTPVEELAAMMLEEVVRRVPITSGGRVVGIVSASDIVQLFLNLHEQPRQAPEPASAGRRESARRRER